MTAGRVVAVFGPTGCGKTVVAVEVARRLGTRVISCDSMQLYRGLPVLTNQPSKAELSRAPHALVGVVDPGVEWNAAVYAEHARPLIDHDVARGGWALIVGGTGLYLRAALAPLAMPPACDPRLRAELTARGEREGPAVLHAELAVLDPAAAAAIHPRNLRRVIRALEVVLAEGPGSWSGRSDLWAPSYRRPTVLIGLTMDRRELYARIDARTAHMLAGGAVDEVAAHRAAVAAAGGATGDAAPRGLEIGPAHVATGVAKAVGYAEIAAYLDGRASLDETEAVVAAATRRYARRQLTWLRRLGDAVIVDATGRDPAAVATEIVALATGEQEH